MFSQCARLLARYSLSTLFVATFAVTVIRWIAFAAFADVPVVVWVSQAAHAVSFGLFHAVGIEFVRRIFVDGTEGRGQALYSAIGFGVGAAAGSAMAGFTWASFGAGVTFLSAAALSLGGLGVALFGLRQARHRSP